MVVVVVAPLAGLGGGGVTAGGAGAGSRGATLFLLRSSNGCWGHATGDRLVLLATWGPGPGEAHGGEGTAGICLLPLLGANSSSIGFVYWNTTIICINTKVKIGVISNLFLTMSNLR